MSCVEMVKHSKVKVEENGKKAVFLNPKRAEFAIHTIDGCLITEGQKCDFAVEDDAGNIAFVELKGSDVAHACAQLFATIAHEACRELIKKKIGFLIVTGKIPKFDSHVARSKIRAAREFKAGFHVEKNQGEFVINRVVAIDGPR